MIEIRVDTRRLESALSEYANLARKDLGAVVKQQAGILVGHVIALTPPGGRKGEAMTDSGGVSMAAKKRGEANIASDIAKIFPTSNLPIAALQGMVEQGFEWQVGRGQKATVREVAESVEDLRRVHQFARNPKTGRTRKMNGIGMAVTRKAVLRQYIRQEIAKTGKLSAGWLNAGIELRTAPRAMPAWIRRHGNRPGGADVSDRGGRVGIRIFNSQVWFPGNMSTRVALAVARRERGLQKACEAILEKRARAAERRQGR